MQRRLKWSKRTSRPSPFQSRGIATGAFFFARTEYGATIVREGQTNDVSHAGMRHVLGHEVPLRQPFGGAIGEDEQQQERPEGLGFAGQHHRKVMTVGEVAVVHAWLTVWKMRGF